jgi:hypothetical protein
MVNLILLGIAPLYIVGFLALLGVMNQRKRLRQEVRQYANLRRVANGRKYK